MFIYDNYPIFQLTDYADQMIAEVQPLFIGVFFADAEKAIPPNPEIYVTGMALTMNRAYRVAPNEPRS